MRFTQSSLVQRLLTASWMVSVCAVVLLLAFSISFFRALALVIALMAVSLASIEVALVRGSTERTPWVNLVVTSLLGAFPSFALVMYALGKVCSLGLDRGLAALVTPDLGLSPCLRLVISQAVICLIGILCLLILRFEKKVDSNGEVLQLLVLAILVSFGGGILVLYSLFPAYLFWLIAVVSSNDSAAYFAGKRFGKRRLSPVVSPGKTVVGSGAGFLGGAFAAFLCSFILPLPEVLQFDFGITAALCVVVGAQISDLAKSSMKRCFGVKDSGSLLPGHGGVLDRIDGHLGGALVLLAILILP